MFIFHLVKSSARFYLKLATIGQFSIRTRLNYHKGAELIYEAERNIFEITKMSVWSSTYWKYKDSKSNGEMWNIGYIFHLCDVLFLTKTKVINTTERRVVIYCKCWSKKSSERECKHFFWEKSGQNCSTSVIGSI